ncbi:AFG1 family ATPase [Paroceanicella profunda]|uniref:AFG1 family ATPase n=1 Tax=Paroceanicella profunda TaxID=2579971 RepID=A0A5B8FV65_9RHOB|nr:cell division protein ZapE [Paroceanicella profunda]QDL90970.1 AFG1 family ATPase [Paroceanicella profunda]
MTQGPQTRYRALVAEGKIRSDAAQRHAAEKLQILHDRLAGYDPVKPKKVGIGLFGWGRDKLKETPIPGLYLYGGVGRGKSMLMDLFFDSAPVERKRRVHFHAFMQEIHAGINASRARGERDPVGHVAETVADSATLLCFDELQITDITDAMIVGRLFEKLFERGVVIVITSNRHPDDLYKSGLNRQLFVPFIALIKDRLEVHHLESENDYRQSRLAGMTVWHAPLGPEATAAMDAQWEMLAGGEGTALHIGVSGRDVVLPRFRNGTARAGFADLCAKPLGPADYLAITAKVRTLMIDDIPRLSRANNNEAKRFVTLIDALYEGRRRIVCSAAAGPDSLYLEGEGAFEFERTASRLAEMQSADWIEAAD